MLTAFLLFYACADESDKFFNVIKIVIVAHDALTMIYDAVFFVALKAVKKIFNAVFSGKFGKCSRLYLVCKQTFAAVSLTAFVTGVHLLIKDTSSVFTPVSTFTPVQLKKTVGRTALALHIFRAETTGKTASCDTKFTFHYSSFPFDSAGQGIAWTFFTDNAVQDKTAFFKHTL